MKLPSKDVDPSVSGAHVRVEFVIGDTLIIFSPAINSNRGLMAVPSSLVETPGPPKVDPSMPAPFMPSSFGGGGDASGGGGGGMRYGDASVAGALSIGSAVRIVKGVHKGKDGVVRKMMGNKMSVQVRGGQQVEVSADMIKADTPNSTSSFGLTRPEASPSQSQTSFRTPHVPFSPGQSLPTSSPAPASPAPSGWSQTASSYGATAFGSSRLGTPGSSVARSPAPFSSGSLSGSAWPSQSPAPNTPGVQARRVCVAASAL